MDSPLTPKHFALIRCSSFVAGLAAELPIAPVPVAAEPGDPQSSHFLHSGCSLGLSCGQQGWSGSLHAALSRANHKSPWNCNRRLGLARLLPHLLLHPQGGDTIPPPCKLGIAAPAPHLEQCPAQALSCSTVGTVPTNPCRLCTHFLDFPDLVGQCVQQACFQEVGHFGHSAIDVVTARKTR